MVTTTTKLTPAVEEYFSDLCRIRASGGATGERSYYPALTNLLNAVGGALRPQVFCVSELAEQGAGHPDLGLYAKRQVQKGTPRPGQIPERGVVEVKPYDDDAWLTASSDQVSRYWGLYRLVLVTNTRDFVLVGEDAQGNPVKLETFRLEETEQEFEARLKRPRAFTRDVGAGLGEYLCRVLSHMASIVEPRDLAWLLASYARDGLARVEAAGDARPPFTPSAPHWRRPWAFASRVTVARPSSAQRWCRPSSTASSPRGCCGRARRLPLPDNSTGKPPSGI